MSRKHYIPKGYTVISLLFKLVPKSLLFFGAELCFSTLKALLFAILSLDIISFLILSLDIKVYYTITLQHENMVENMQLYVFDLIYEYHVRRHLHEMSIPVIIPLIEDYAETR